MASGTASYARIGPIRFQPLESELAQVAGHLRGDLLNAGCGSRDISGILCRLGAASVTNVDLASEIPGAIQASLDCLPLPGERFDTVLCNAVLEHVGPIDAVMAELVRVLKPGGRMVVAIPFLQPCHLCPTDYRRFTADGMRQLGERHGLKVILVQPLHSIAQTLGWILWEHLLETRATVTRKLVWPLLWLATRLFQRGNPAAVRAANTFQAVFEKPVAAP